jgi:hypothetical protein
MGSILRTTLVLTLCGGLGCSEADDDPDFVEASGDAVALEFDWPDGAQVELVHAWEWGDDGSTPSSSDWDAIRWTATERDDGFVLTADVLSSEALDEEEPSPLRDLRAVLHTAGDARITDDGDWDGFDDLDSAWAAVEEALNAHPDPLPEPLRFRNAAQYDGWRAAQWRRLLLHDLEGIVAEPDELLRLAPGRVPGLDRDSEREASFQGADTCPSGRGDCASFEIREAVFDGAGRTLATVFHGLTLHPATMQPETLTVDTVLFDHEELTNAVASSSWRRDDVRLTWLP